MSAPDGLYPPVQYEGWWLALALGILVLLAAAAWIMWAAVRPRRERAPEPAPLSVQLDSLRAHHLERIDRVERAYADGTMSPRIANAELSAISRSFVNAFTGIETPVLPLEDLEARGASPELVAAVRRHFYPSVFERDVPADPAAGIAAARQVVTGWH
ncbi:hypothetical protein GCM10010915_03330 [Microbacterium faecale]|uniref:DUF4381 domain-containing protein n=1 Tax=Microbacterium faecale TaxID=1804630 RepID=A0A916Y182_9MICO|nr:hypothetical protein [Microbacterium faecale]GGD26622.1 hypothetical protein GCM10010915_03330 [Microbacterium faecale]